MKMCPTLRIASRKVSLNSDRDVNMRTYLDEAKSGKKKRQRMRKGEKRWLFQVRCMKRTSPLFS